MEFVYGHLLEVGRSGQLNQFKFQNYAVGQNVGDYSFLPFGFGGAMATLQGDNLDATVQFANTEIARNFVVEALDNTYVAKVSTVLWNSSTYAVERTLYEYFGACSSGGWDEASIQIKLNSVLDAVQANIPGRRLRRQQVGNIPFTAQVRV
jgi:hypothetical protein|tara:strand:- start:5680 stop:6132 length:453 start_codon:yes stop_codon:yes gene_type:complete